jgi:DNA-directed RNA polymerase specialized sigma subunit
MEKNLFWLQLNHYQISSKRKWNMVRIQTLKVKTLLHDVDKNFVYNLIENINFTSKEKKILFDTEIEKKSIKELSLEMNISTYYVSVIKTTAIKKVYKYAINKNLIKE